MRVVVKPNFVLHTHPDGDAAMRATVTDAAVLRVVLDYIALALRGSGTITIAESPIRMTDLRALVRWNGLDVVLDDVSSTWKLPVELIDVRDQVVADAETFHTSLRVRHQTGAPARRRSRRFGRSKRLRADAREYAQVARHGCRRTE